MSDQVGCLTVPPGHIYSETSTVDARQDFIDRAAIAVLPAACAPDNHGEYMDYGRRVAMALDLAEALWAERESRRKEHP